MKKYLVVGIVLLFIGVGIQPVLSNKVSMSAFNDDNTPPNIILHYHIELIGKEWFIVFIADCSDTESGIDRVEFDIDGEIIETVYFVPYECLYKQSQLKGHKYFNATAYDKAGNSASDGYFLGARSLDIASIDDCDCQSNSKAHLAEKLLNKLGKNEVLSNVIDSDNLIYDRPICELLLKWALYYNDIGWYYFYSGHYFMGRIYLVISLYIYSMGVPLLCWPFIP